MKAVLIFLMCLVPLISARSQGTIFFDNRVPGVVDARFSVGPFPMDNNWTAQLFIGNFGDTFNFKPVFPATTFKTSTEADKGYVIPVVVTVPDRAPRSVVGVQMRATGNFDPMSVAYGLPLAIRLGGDGFPPAYLEGLLPVVYIPEPSTWAFWSVSLAACMLLVMRSAKRRES